MTSLSVYFPERAHKADLSFEYVKYTEKCLRFISNALRRGSCQVRRSTTKSRLVINDGLVGLLARQCRRWKFIPHAERAENKRNKKRARHKLRTVTDPVYAITQSTREAVAMSLYKRNQKKTGRTFGVLGYTPDELATHLERQFLSGMNWGNRKLWHVDHIIPLCSFKFASMQDPEFKAAWALTNLRPMWAIDNLKKGAKRLTLL